LLKKIKKIIAGFSVLIVGVVALTAMCFSDNIKGYYKFKHLCDTEGGLKVYEKLEASAGWEVDYRRNAYVPAAFEEVDFVRFRDSKDESELFDLKYRDGMRDRRKSYDILNADISMQTKYKYIYKDSRIDPKLLISKTVYKVIDKEKKSTSIEFISFGYSMFNRNKTLLAAPSARRCFRFNLGMIGDNFK